MATPASFFGAFAWNNPSSYRKVTSVLFVVVASISWMQQKDDGRKSDGDGVLGKCTVIPFFFTHFPFNGPGMSVVV